MDENHGGAGWSTSGGEDTRSGSVRSGVDGLGGDGGEQFGRISHLGDHGYQLLLAGIGIGSGGIVDETTEVDGVESDEACGDTIGTSAPVGFGLGRPFDEVTGLDVGIDGGSVLGGAGQSLTETVGSDDQISFETGGAGLSITLLVGVLCPAHSSSPPPATRR